MVNFEQVLNFCATKSIRPGKNINESDIFKHIKINIISWENINTGVEF